MLEMLAGYMWYEIAGAVLVWFLVGCYMTGLFMALLDEHEDQRVLILGFLWPVTFPVAVVCVFALYFLQRLATRGAGLGSRARNLVA